MNRLWVRLSLIFGSLLLVATLLPLATFTIFVLTFEPMERANMPLPPDSKQADAVAGTQAITMTSPLTAAVTGPVIGVMVDPAGDILVAEGPPPFPRNPWRDVPLNLLRSFAVAGILGVIGGIAVSRFLAAPIAQMAKAAHSIGAGDLSTRVPVNRSSAEFEDLTDAFNKMAADLQHADDLRTSLMADVSHELRTPLTVLEGNLRAALDHVYDLDEEQIANLYEQTRHLIRLVNDLRELALAEADQLPLDIRPLQLEPLIQEIAAAFELLADEKGIRLMVEVEDALPPVCADRMRIRQSLHNLLANALRHTPDGGTITITAQAEEGGVTLSVADNGEGIDAQALPHVFDRFYRTDPSRTRETGGSGLGLAIVKAFIEAQGGSIAAASAGRGQGSTFTLHLPEDEGVTG